MSSITENNRSGRLTELEESGVRLLDPVSDRSIPGEPDWFAKALTAFRNSVADREYPCHFGRRALEQSQLFVTHLEADQPDALAAPLAAFLDFARPNPELRQIMSAFVNTGDTPLGHDEYGELFWSVLQNLHDADTEPWPADIPDDANDPGWEFSFHGTPMFVFAAAPTHQLRQSRNLGQCLVLLFQPRNVFHGIEGGTRTGMLARRRIRDRLARWDTAAPHPSMGDYGDPSNFEWRQYFIAEDDSEAFSRCPFRP